jgi:hypothetical protein
MASKALVYTFQYIRRFFNPGCAPELKNLLVVALPQTPEGGADAPTL